MLHKKRYVRQIITIVFALCLLSACTPEDGRLFWGLKRLELDNHTYIVYRSNHGVAMLHDPDCKCTTNKMSKQ